MKKFTIIGVLLILSAATVWSDSMDLNKCVQTALNQNISLMIATEKIKVEQKNDNWGNAGFLPVLSLSGYQTESLKDVDYIYQSGSETSRSGSDSSQTFIGLTAQFVLFDGLGSFHRLSKQKQMIIRTQIEARIQAESIVMDIITNYYEYLQLKELIKITSDNLQISSERLDRLKQKSKLGDVSQLDYLEAKVELDDDRLKLSAQQYDLSVRKRELEYLTGIQNIVFDSQQEHSIREYKLSALMTEAQRRNAGLQLKKVQRELSYIEANLIIASLYPQVSFEYEYSDSHSQSESGFMKTNKSRGGSYSVAANMNLFNGFRDMTQLANVESGQKILDFELKDLEKILLKNMTNLFYKLQLSKEQITIDAHTIEQSRKTYQKAQELFELGQLTQIELKEYQLQLNETRYTAVKHKYQAILNEWELIRLSGQLLARF